MANPVLETPPRMNGTMDEVDDVCCICLDGEFEDLPVFEEKNQNLTVDTSWSLFKAQIHQCKPQQAYRLKCGHRWKSSGGNPREPPAPDRDEQCVARCFIVHFHANVLIWKWLLLVTQLSLWLHSEGSRKIPWEVVHIYFIFIDVCCVHDASQDNHNRPLLQMSNVSHSTPCWFNTPRTFREAPRTNVIHIVIMYRPDCPWLHGALCREFQGKNNPTFVAPIKNRVSAARNAVRYDSLYDFPCMLKSFNLRPTFFRLALEKNQRLQSAA